MEGLLGKWREVWDERAGVTAGLDRQIRELEHMRAEASRPFDERLAALEAEIKPLVESTVKSDGVEVSYRSGYTRYTWDNKALEGYCVDHPDLLKFRKRTGVSPSWTFKRLL